MNTEHDRRLGMLKTWVAAELGAGWAWSVVSVDASRRRYFRARRETDDGVERWIAVDAPPEYENVAAFVSVAEAMRAAGLNVPVIRAYDEAAGFMLVGDLGDRRYLDVLDEHNADALFGSAIGALLDWQAASRPGVLPAYDRATFEREIRLFDQWYLPKVLGHTPNDAARAAIERAYGFILDRVMAQAPVFVHRDYMPRNLMVDHPLPGIIDFQDARYGPATYDVASLFRDAFISWPADRVRGWVRHYWDGALGRDLPVNRDWATFEADLALTGAQRHLKIMGLFVRISRRDGKPAYEADLGRFADYLAPVVEAFDELAPLRVYIADAPTVRS